MKGFTQCKTKEYVVWNEVQENKFLKKLNLMQSIVWHGITCKKKHHLEWNKM